MEFPIAVRAALAELSIIPYENLSKIVARSRSRSLESALDFSWIHREDPRRPGWGGTCFALTHWLKLKMGALNQATAYLMADKSHSPNIHCGLLWEYAGRSFLLDPGYLLFDPLPLPCRGDKAFAVAPPNSVCIEDDASSGCWRLFTGPAAQLKYRFDFRKQPVSAVEFQQHWEASYHWPMMRYPVLNRVVDGVQYYLQKNNLLIRTSQGGSMRRLTGPEVAAEAESTFGLNSDLIGEALTLLHLE